MGWSLTFPDQHPYFMVGQDDQRRAELFLPLLERHRNDPKYRCLQVGVPSWENSKMGSSFTSLDLFDQRPCIDVRADLAHTPFPDEHFHFIVCNAILEHVQDPFACVAEMYRILKPGGIVWAEVPFVQPYHPYKTYTVSDGVLPKKSDGFKNDEDHGGDYWRFTPQGVKQLFKRFELNEVLVIGDGGIVFYGQKP